MELEIKYFLNTDKGCLELTEEEYRLTQKAFVTEKPEILEQQIEDIEEDMESANQMQDELGCEDTVAEEVQYA